MTGQEIGEYRREPPRIQQADVATALGMRASDLVGIERGRIPVSDELEVKLLTTIQQFKEQSVRDMARTVGVAVAE